MKQEKLYISIVIVLCLLTGNLLKAQTALTAVALPAEVGIDEYFNYKLIFENAVDIRDLRLPDFKSFTVLGSPSRESGMNAINGQVTRYTGIVYTLKPTKLGTFTIGKATATLNGTILQSNVAQVKVVKQSKKYAQSPLGYMDPYPETDRRVNYEDYILKKGQSVAERANENMEMRLEVDRTSCYVGEPIVATYKLYTRLKSDSKLSQNPSFNGFSVIDLQQGSAYSNQVEKLNGKEYNVYIIRKSQLYPLQAGTIELEAAELENTVQFIKAEYAGKLKDRMEGLFDDFFMGLPPDAVINQTVVLRNKPVNITVKPLPDLNKPGGFSDAVGRFNIEASLKKINFSTDEPGILTITISGSGNMQLLNTPEVNWPAGIESFEPKINDRFNNSVVPVSGSRVIEIPFAVDKEGTYNIPAIAFHYFDAAKEQYQTTTTIAINFTVSKGTGLRQLAQEGIIQKPKPSFLNRIFDYRYGMIAVVAVLILGGLLTWLLIDKRKSHQHAVDEVAESKDDATAVVVPAAVDFNKPVFEKTETCYSNESCDNFYGLLNTELKQFISSRFSIAPNDAGTQQVSAALDKYGMPNEVVLRLQQLFREIEWQLYTPFERNEKMQQVFTEAKEITALIDAYLVKRR